MGSTEQGLWHRPPLGMWKCSSYPHARVPGAFPLQSLHSCCFFPTQSMLPTGLLQPGTQPKLELQAGSTQEAGSLAVPCMQPAQRSMGNHCRMWSWGGKSLSPTSSSLSEGADCPRAREGRCRASGRAARDQGLTSKLVHIAARPRQLDCRGLLIPGLLPPLAHLHSQLRT